MRLLTDVPDVGTGRGVRFYACTGCEHIHKRQIDWKEHFALEEFASERARNELSGSESALGEGA